MRKVALMTPDEAVKAMYSDPEYIKGFLGTRLWSSEDRLVRKYFLAGTMVLDIGCGAGRVAPALERDGGYQTTGIDILPTMLAAAKGQREAAGARCPFMLMDASDMDGFPDESFHNVIMAYNMYELVHGKERRKQVISEVARVLKPGDHLILTVRSGFAFGKRMIWWLLVPVIYPYFMFRFRGRCEWALGDALRGKSYHHYYNPFSLKRRIKRSGFELLYFNSDGNIVRDRPSTLLTYFSPDRALFFVFR